MSTYEQQMKSRIVKVIEGYSESELEEVGKDKEGLLLDHNVNALFEGYEAYLKELERHNKEENGELNAYNDIEDYTLTTIGV